MNKFELKCYRSPGRIWKSDDPKDRYWTQDQLMPEDGEIHWISVYKLPEYVESKYGITIQEYYNLVVYGDMTIERTCKNPKCNTKVPYINLSKGYQEYCSHACRMSDQWNNEEYRSAKLKQLSETRTLLNNEWWSDPKYREERSNLGKELFRSPEFIRSKVLSYGDPDIPFWFYIARSPLYLDQIKVGVSKDIYYRSRHYYKCYAILVTLHDAAWIEYEMASFIKDNNFNYLDRRHNEWAANEYFKIIYKKLIEVLIKYGHSINDFIKIK